MPLLECKKQTTHLVITFVNLTGIFIKLTFSRQAIQRIN